MMCSGASRDRGLNVTVTRSKCLIGLQTLTIGSVGRRSTVEEQPQPDGDEDDSYDSYDNAVGDVIGMVFRKIEAETAIYDGEENKQRTQEEVNLAHDGWLFCPAVDEMVDEPESELDEDRCENDQT